MSLRIASFCSGFGGLEMAVQAVFGGETVFHADPFPAVVAWADCQHKPVATPTP